MKNIYIYVYTNKPIYWLVGKDAAPEMSMYLQMCGATRMYGEK